MPRDIFGHIIREDIYGRKISKKKIKKEVIAENRAKGRAGEEQIRSRYELSGHEVERSPRGKDFVVRKRDLFSGRVTSTKHVEVKTGKAKLSKLQKKTKKGKGNYKVERADPMFW